MKNIYFLLVLFLASCYSNKAISQEKQNSDNQNTQKTIDEKTSNQGVFMDPETPQENADSFQQDPNYKTKPRVYYWEVTGLTGYASGTISSLAEAKECIEIMRKGVVLKNYIIRSANMYKWLLGDAQ